MTSELRPEVEVWDDAIAAWAADTIDTRQAAAAVIQAYGDEREAKGRADQAAEIARLSEALSAIADGEGDAQDIARQTLAREEDK